MFALSQELYIYIHIYIYIYIYKWSLKRIDRASAKMLPILHLDDHLCNLIHGIRIKVTNWLWKFIKRNLCQTNPQGLRLWRIWGRIWKLQLENWGKRNRKWNGNVLSISLFTKSVVSRLKWDWTHDEAFACVIPNAWHYIHGISKPLTGVYNKLPTKHIFNVYICIHISVINK